MAARKPDYDLSLLNKTTNEKVFAVGAGWCNADGSITVVINRFVVLPTGPEWLITLFPRRTEK